MQLDKIQQEIASLPPEAQALLFDFISFLKQRYAIQSKPTQHPDDHDPLIGMFAFSPDLATRSEDILSKEIQHPSGWTWKT